MKKMKYLLYFLMCSISVAKAQIKTERADTFVRNKGIETDTFIMPPKHYFPVIQKEKYFKELIKKEGASNKPMANSYATLGNISVPMHPLEESFYNYYKSKFTSHLISMKKWGKNYFDLYDQILPQYGIPPEMKYLSVIESDLNPGCVSWAGAVGPWQLMPDEADRYGLIHNSAVDERKDVYKATHVACKLLKELYDWFGNWLLVVAAYNGGPNRMKRILKQSGTKDFFKMDYMFPRETQNHVKKFIAVHYIMEGNGGITTVTPVELERLGKPQNLTVNTYKASAADDALGLSTVNIAGYYISNIIANTLLINIDVFNKYNPGFDGLVNKSPDGFLLRLPNDKMNLFKAKRLEILQACVQYKMKQLTPKKK
jgi:membrane-bound lytic murein transglycosylase D